MNKADSCMCSQGQINCCLRAGDDVMMVAQAWGSSNLKWLALESERWAVYQGRCILIKHINVLHYGKPLVEELSSSFMWKPYKFRHDVTMLTCFCNVIINVALGSRLLLTVNYGDGCRLISVCDSSRRLGLISHVSYQCRLSWVIHLFIFSFRLQFGLI